MQSSVGGKFPQLSFSSENVSIFPSFIKYLWCIDNSRLTFFFFQCFKDGICFVLVCTISDEKSVITLTVDPLNSIHLFSPSDSVSTFIFIFIFKESNCNIPCNYKISSYFILIWLFGALEWKSSTIEKFSAINSLYIIPFQVLFSFWDFN